jgi:hypothetical protein
VEVDMKENLITKTETLRNNIKNTTLNLNDLRYQFLEQGETEMVQALDKLCADMEFCSIQSIEITGRLKNSIPHKRLSLKSLFSF